MVGGNSAVAYYAIKTYGTYDSKKHFLPSVRAVAELMGIQIKNEDGTISLPGATEPHAVLLRLLNWNLKSQNFGCCLSSIFKLMPYPTKSSKRMDK
ncbi:hypothetical protein A1T07_22630 (plasmid) [Lysinibacillus sphaericus]|nr:hypothetical protein A1T07_22630 [Lysinibacillus sphaericus]